MWISKSGVVCCRKFFERKGRPAPLAPKEWTRIEDFHMAVTDAIKKRESSTAVVMCPRCRKDRKSWYVFVDKQPCHIGPKNAARFEMTCQKCEFNWNRDALW